jgi:hypothetical protein
MWFKPRCPVDPDHQAWIESRMLWTDREFDLDSFRRVSVILPTPEFFPDPFSGSEADVEALLHRVCGYMRVDPSRVSLGFYSERGPDLGEGFRLQGRRKGSAGLYQRGDISKIWIELSKLDDLLALIATLAHELGHVHLLGDGRISRDSEDHEPLTDLLTVCMGMGLITANAYLREKHWQGVRYSGWSLSRQGYLSAPMYGYALALFAEARGERNPAWAQHLRLDIRAPFKQSLRYLARTRQTPTSPSSGV